MICSIVIVLYDATIEIIAPRDCHPNFDKIGDAG